MVNLPCVSVLSAAQCPPASAFVANRASENVATKILFDILKTFSLLIFTIVAFDGNVSRGGDTCYAYSPYGTHIVLISVPAFNQLV